MLAQMLQMEFDREYDAQLRREEKKFNGDSKGILLWRFHWVVGDAHTHSQINSQLFLPFKFPFHLKTIEKCILLKTVTALKTRLTGRILVMIPTDQVPFVSGVQLGRAEKIKCPDELVRYMFRFEFHLIIHFIRFKCLSSAECKTLLFAVFIFLAFLFLYFSL